MNTETNAPAQTIDIDAALSAVAAVPGCSAKWAAYYAPRKVIELFVGGRFVAMVWAGSRDRAGTVVVTRQTGRKIGDGATKALRSVGPIVWA